jgi:hypothetical protein
MMAKGVESHEADERSDDLSLDSLMQIVRRIQLSCFSGCTEMIDLS